MKKKDDLIDLIKAIDKSLISICARQSGMERDLRMLRKDMEILKIKDKKFKKEIEEIVKINECVDQTLSNVLLAIRQNEYLQAWYPEQLGYPQMKVTGIHPKKLEKIA